MMMSHDQTVSFSVACAPVRRIKRSTDYSSRDYEVYITGEGTTLLSWETGVDKEPSKVALENLSKEYGLFGSCAYPLMASPTRVNQLTLYYAVPVSIEGAGKYWTISQLLEQFQLDLETRNMISTLDLWLRDRHTLPFVNVDTLFLCSKEGEGIGGLVKAVIENPIHQSQLRPPEDNLVISLNNPVFVNNTQDTTIA